MVEILNAKINLHLILYVDPHTRELGMPVSACVIMYVRKEVAHDSNPGYTEITDRLGTA